MKPFTPRSAGTKSITVTASSQRVALTEAQGTVDVRVYNGDTQTVFIEFGGSGVAATTTAGVPIPSGAIEVFQARVSSGTLYAAAIGTAANSRSIHFTPGQGI